VLPVATLLVVGLAYTTRLVRAGVVEVAQSDYVQLARLYGLPSHVITTRYVLRNSVAMSIQSFTQTAQWLLGGVVVVEVVFAYPGLGTEIVNAVFNRDLPMVQSLVFVLALVFITLNTLADIAVVAVVPRLRTST
jgi:peptide/nickel transport system permease protein